MIGRTTIASPRTTGLLTVLDTARIADSPGLMIAVKVLDVEHAHVRDGEGRSAHLVRREAAGARLVDELPGAGAELGHRHFVGVAHDWDDQSLVEVDGDAQMDAAMPADGLAVGGAVDRGKFFQRQNAGLGDEIGDRVGRARQL